MVNFFERLPFTKKPEKPKAPPINHAAEWAKKYEAERLRKEAENQARVDAKAKNRNKGGIDRVGALAVFDEVVYKMEQNGNRFLNYKTLNGNEYTLKQIIDNFLKTPEGERYIMNEGQSKAAMKLTSFIINLQDKCIERSVLNTYGEGIYLTEEQLNELLRGVANVYEGQVKYMEAKAEGLGQIKQGDPDDPKTWRI